MSSRPLALAFAVVSTLAACDTAVDGKNDILEFRYDVSEELIPTSLSTPIATGLRARIEAFKNRENRTDAPTPAAILDARSSDASILEVIATTGNVLTVEASSPGTVEITVSTVLGDDVFNVSVADLATVDLQHPGVIVSETPPSKCIQGGTARFFVRLKDAAGKALIGSGAIAATILPNGAATLQDGDNLGFLSVRFGVPGAATIQTLGDDALPIDIVADQDVTSLQLDGPDAVADLKVGAVLLAKLRGVTDDGSKVVGVASVATVASSAPAVCTIEPSPKLGEGAYTITAKSVGTCRVEATLGSRAARHDILVKAL